MVPAAGLSGVNVALYPVTASEFGSRWDPSYLSRRLCADRIEVVWPSSGRVETVTNVPAHQIVIFEEGKGIVARQPFSR